MFFFSSSRTVRFRRMKTSRVCSTLIFNNSTTCSKKTTSISRVKKRLFFFGESKMFRFFFSAKDEILRLVSTGSILFYFLFHSQKTNFPVDLTAIQQFINNARSELETVRKNVAFSRFDFLREFVFSFQRKTIRSCKLTSTKANLRLIT